MSNLSLVNLSLADSGIISHDGNHSLEKEVEKTKGRLREDKNLTYSLDESFFYLDQLLQFELGRFLLQNKGLDGRWISYIIKDHADKIVTSPLENWFLNKAPIVLATRERFTVFQEETQKRLKSGMTVASLPSGVMDDLLSLNYEGLNDVHLYGIDLDQKSLDLALRRKEEKKVSPQVSLLRRDAWQLEESEKFDLLVSNGLNIYEPSEQRIIALFKEFYKALKPGGTLIASFLTPPPYHEESPWTGYNNYDLTKQKVILNEIIQTKWLTFWTEDQVRDQLSKAGFKEVSFRYDRQQMFPTILAVKEA